MCTVYRGFPEAQMVKSPPANIRDEGSIPGRGRSPGEGNAPTPVFWPGKSHGHSSLMGYSLLLLLLSRFSHVRLCATP